MKHAELIYKAHISVNNAHMHAFLSFGELYCEDLSARVMTPVVPRNNYMYNVSFL